MFGKDAERWENRKRCWRGFYGASEMDIFMSGCRVGIQNNYLLG